jgi:hypothetical protein
MIRRSGQVVQAQNLTGFLKENGRESSAIVRHKGLVHTMPCYDLGSVGFAQVTVETSAYLVNLSINLRIYLLQLLDRGRGHTMSNCKHLNACVGSVTLPNGALISIFPLRL